MFGCSKLRMISISLQSARSSLSGFDGRPSRGWGGAEAPPGADDVGMAIIFTAMSTPVASSLHV